MHRRRSTIFLKEGSSVKVSARALIIRLPILGSAAQCGINPQCISQAFVKSQKRFTDWPASLKNWITMASRLGLG
jgi:hypothetical protein